MSNSIEECFLLYDDITQLASDLLEMSVGIEGMSDDPRIMSVTLYTRMISNHRAYKLLWTNGLFLESEIILRAALECAICIAANSTMKNKFIKMLSVDGAHTALQQHKLFTRRGKEDLANSSIELYKFLMLDHSDVKKTSGLSWESLADESDVPELYENYRALSGFSAHITGFSVLRDTFSSDEDAQGPLSDHDDRQANLKMMAYATLLSTTRHAEMMKTERHRERSLILTNRLVAIFVSPNA